MDISTEGYTSGQGSVNNPSALQSYQVEMQNNQQELTAVANQQQYPSGQDKQQPQQEQYVVGQQDPSNINVSSAPLFAQPPTIPSVPFQDGSTAGASAPGPLLDPVDAPLINQDKGPLLQQPLMGQAGIPINSIADSGQTATEETPEENAEANSEGDDVQPQEMEVDLLPENHTIYINNLNEKVKEPELKKALTAVFKQFGKILQIVAMKSYHRRGQAFVVFDSIESAKGALSAMQGFPFVGKPMRINFAKSTSDIMAKKLGTYTPRPKKPLPPKPAQIPSQAAFAQQPPPPQVPPPPNTGWYAAGNSTGSEMGDQQQKRAKLGDTQNASQSQQEHEPTSTYYNQAPGQQQHQAVAFGNGQMPGAPPVPPPPGMPPVAPQVEEPNVILFVQNIPPDAPSEALQELFQRYPGFKEVRTVPSRPDIAFVEYETVAQSGIAKMQVNGYNITAASQLSVSFAKK